MFSHAPAFQSPSIASKEHEMVLLRIACMMSQYVLLLLLLLGRQGLRDDAGGAGRMLLGVVRHHGALVRVLVFPLVHGPTPRVHEEVAHCGRFQAQLSRDGHLHFFGWSFRFLGNRDVGKSHIKRKMQKRHGWRTVSFLSYIYLTR